MNGLMLKYFVLKPAGEGIYSVASRRAMRAYAFTILKENPQFAKELREWADNEWLQTTLAKELSITVTPLDPEIDDK